LQAGAGSFWGATVTVLAGMTGTYYIIAKADNEYVSAEFHETNNNSYTSITVGP
jgi:hypothetical protein